jgi:hypothetical protein
LGAALAQVRENPGLLVWGHVFHTRVTNLVEMASRILWKAKESFNIPHIAPELMLQPRRKASLADSAWVE